MINRKIQISVCIETVKVLSLYVGVRLFPGDVLVGGGVDRPPTDYIPPQFVWSAPPLSKLPGQLYTALGGHCAAHSGCMSPHPLGHAMSRVVRLQAHEARHAFCPHPFVCFHIPNPHTPISLTHTHPHSYPPAHTPICNHAHTHLHSTHTHRHSHPHIPTHTPPLTPL